MTVSGAVLFAAFALRLALGLAGSLFLLPAHEVAPRFYRAHFLIILGLLVAAALFVWSLIDGVERIALGTGIVLAYISSMIWTLEGAPGSRVLLILTTMALLYLTGAVAASFSFLGLADAWTSAAVVGLALSAMLLGHSYLIASGMSMTPLVRLLVGLFTAVALRLGVTCLAWWTGGPPLSSLAADTIVWLTLRWGAGFAGTLLMGWLAWRCARIRSTQSATGILYVVVIFAFIGELIGLVGLQS